MEDLNDYLLDIEGIEEIEVINNGGNRKRKEYKTRFNAFVLSDEDFKAKYRFTKQYIQIITDIVKEDLEHDPRGGSISCELQVLIALRTWARNEVSTVFTKFYVGL